MTPAPLPPHERAWRHPSEMGRAVHEPPRGRSHLLIASTAAAGMILVALLMVGMTPTSRSTEVASPGTDTATSVLASTWATPATFPPPAADHEHVSTVVLTVVTLDTVVTVTASFVRRDDLTGSSSEPTIGLDEIAAIPVGTDGLAVVEYDEPMAEGEVFTARLPSGAEVDVVVLATGTAGMMIVSMAEEPADGTASTRPASSATASTGSGTSDVTATSTPGGTSGSWNTSASSAVSAPPAETIAAVQARTITGRDGQLIGVCVEHASGETELMVIDQQRDDATDARC